MRFVEICPVSRRIRAYLTLFRGRLVFRARACVRLLGGLDALTVHPFGGYDGAFGYSICLYRNKPPNLTRARARAKAGYPLSRT